jgi:hypothetical protein
MTDRIEYIASLASRGEIKSWERKCVAMSKLLDQLRPIEEEILEIISKRQPLVDSIEELRHQMTQECIHPQEHLVDMGEYVTCKFCDRKMAPPNAKTE